MTDTELFIFDIDGVLVDSAQANFLSLDAACQEVFNIPVSQELEDELGSIPSSEKIKIILERNGKIATQEELSSFRTKKFQHLLLLFSTIKFNPNVFEIFTLLKNKGVKTAIVSNARDNYVDIIIDRFKIQHLIDFKTGSDNILKPKPNPALYLYAMSKLGVSPLNTVIFEDSEVGLAAAKASCAKVHEIKTVNDLTVELVGSML